MRLDFIAVEVSSLLRTESWKALLYYSAVAFGAKNPSSCSRESMFIRARCFVLDVLRVEQPASIWPRSQEARRELVVLHGSLI